MSETRWTAPWSVEVEPDDRELVLDANGHIVCSLTMERGVSLPRAHLIAAAPELTEALEECIDELQDKLDARFSTGLLDVIRKARAALAKAKGEKQ